MKRSGLTALANHEIVTIAVYLVGGDANRADIEDVAKKANELAPGRFTWRKYPDQINIHTIGAFLYDAKKPKNGRLLMGSKNEGWLLTDAGLGFVKQHIPGLQDVDLSRKAISPKERNWRRRERERMLSSDAYQKFTVGAPDTISLKEAQAFFRVDDYVTGTARSQKLARTSNVFGTDPDLAGLIRLLISKLTNEEPK